MAEKLIISLVNANPETAEEIYFPLKQAVIAVSMDYSVEVLFSGRAGCMGIKGYAEKLKIANSDKNIAQLIREAYEAGVTFRICAPSVEIWGDNLIEEICEIVGGTYLISEAMDDDTRVFSY